LVNLCCTVVVVVTIRPKGSSDIFPLFLNIYYPLIYFLLKNDKYLRMEEIDIWFREKATSLLSLGPVCNSCPEDDCHFLTECPFPKAMLHHIWAWFHFHGQSPHQDIATWINTCVAAARGELLGIVGRKRTGGFSTQCIRMSCKLRYQRRRISSCIIRL
jgi:hypothetical protein